MRKAMIIMLATFPTMMLANEAKDTTIVVEGKHILINDSAGTTNVKVFNMDGTEKKKVFEGHYADEKEVERFYISSPFYTSDRQFLPTTPNIFIGWNMFPSSIFAMKNNSDMHVSTRKSMEYGFHFVDVGFWLNNQRTWSLSAIDYIVFNETRFHGNYIMTNDKGKTSVVDKGIDIRRNHMFSLELRTQLMLKWYKNFSSKDDRLCIGAGISFDESTYRNYSAYNIDDTPFAEATGLNIRKRRLGIDMQVSWAGCVLYLHQSLSPYFNSGRGPKCYPLSVGIGITLF